MGKYRTASSHKRQDNIANHGGHLGSLELLTSNLDIIPLRMSSSQFRITLLKIGIKVRLIVGSFRKHVLNETEKTNSRIGFGKNISHPLIEITVTILRISGYDAGNF